ASAPMTRPAAVLLLAVDRQDLSIYPSGIGTVVTAHSTDDALRCIERMKPRLVVLDWDCHGIDGAIVCLAGSQLPASTVLISTQDVKRVPDALRAGCHGVLLKPFTINLAAARIGRLWRDASTVSPVVRAVVERGSNRTWPKTVCPSCATGHAVLFDHASHRQ